MSMVAICSYEHKELNNDYKKKPLLIACSGGGGHISAIAGICSYLQHHHPEQLILPNYTPVLLEYKGTSMSRTHIRNGVKLMSAPVLGEALRKAVAVTALPVLPDEKDIKEELNKLSSLEARRMKRKYIDMLLDVYPDGYESAAVWNVLQRYDQTRELNKLISFQHLSDKANYENVYHYYLHLLQQAAQINEPYTEVISTQAMAIPALCDAVNDYNKWLIKSGLGCPVIGIHQYMTDMPTLGAVNFFKSLTGLSTKQQQQLRIYGVGLSEEVMHHFFPKGEHFAAIYAIPPENNPMVRPGFTMAQYDNSANFDKNTALTLQGEEMFHLNPGEKIATIMLGSQAGQSTLDYLQYLLHEDFDKIFIFGAKNNSFLSQKIEALVQDLSKHKHRVVPLENQQDDAISALMTRSNLVIIRGGGLSIMEQLAMNHHPDQTILIHHSEETHASELTSGIPWEDANVEELIKTLYKRGVYCNKTSVNKISRHLMEVELLHLITKGSPEIIRADVIHHLQLLPEAQVYQFLREVQNKDNRNAASLPKDLELYLLQCERQAQEFADTINETLDVCLHKLQIELTKKVKSINLSSLLPLHSNTQAPSSLDKYDILHIVNNSDDELFKNLPTSFFSTARAYKIFYNLQTILNDETHNSFHQKVYHFEEEYQRASIQLSTLSKALQRMVNKILLLLVQYFPALIEKLPPHLEFHIVFNQLNSPSRNRAGFFSGHRVEESETIDASLENAFVSS